MLTLAVHGTSSSHKEFGLRLLPQQEVESFWPKLEVALDAEPELWNYVFTKDNILDRICVGHIQVWIVDGSEGDLLYFMTQRYVTPNGKATLQIFWTYGKGLLMLFDLISDVVDKYAAEWECSHIEVTGRRGFEKAITASGGKFLYATYSRPVVARRGH